MAGTGSAGGHRPLHAAARTAHRHAGGHAGLWYDKFCDGWNADWTGFAGDSGKRDWIATIANVGEARPPKTVGDAGQIAEACRRLKALAASQNGKCFLAKTAWRLASGLGRSHPVENGFAWHHTLGTPYLAGSGLKGLARAYARDWRNDISESVNRIFGPAPKGALAVGSVVFLDAVPVAPVVLEADVMTPHYVAWYEKGEVPGDWHSPVPIPFMTVAPEQSFLFCLLPRSAAAQDVDDCRMAADLLKEALEVLGAGAKTAIGYGQFEVQSEADHKTAAAATAGASPPSRGRASWVGREAIVYGEIVRVIEDRGGRLLVRFAEGTDEEVEEEVERSEARLR
jgi:CRISPR-associated protein Cmr6